MTDGFLWRPANADLRRLGACWAAGVYPRMKWSIVPVPPADATAPLGRSHPSSRLVKTAEPRSQRPAAKSWTLNKKKPNQSIQTADEEEA